MSWSRLFGDMRTLVYQGCSHRWEVWVLITAVRTVRPVVASVSRKDSLSTSWIRATALSCYGKESEGCSRTPGTRE